METDSRSSTASKTASTKEEFSSLKGINLEQFRHDKQHATATYKDIMGARSALLKSPNERTVGEFVQIASFLHSIPFFQEVSQEVALGLATICEHDSFKKNTTIFSEGDSGRKLYIVLRGKVGREVKDILSGQVIEITGLHEAGATFGHHALHENVTRNVTMVCTEYTELVAIDARHYKYLLQKAGVDDARRKYAYLKALPLFEQCSATQLVAITKYMSVEKFKKNDVLIRQGGVPDKVYFIVSGECRVIQRAIVSLPSQKKGQPDITSLELIDLARVVPPWFVGEKGVLLDQPRSAFVYADTPVTCYVIGKDDFIKSLPDSCLQYTHQYFTHFYPKPNEISQQVRQQARWDMFKERTLNSVAPRGRRRGTNSARRHQPIHSSAKAKAGGAATHRGPGPRGRGRRGRHPRSDSQPPMVGRRPRPPLRTKSIDNPELNGFAPEQLDKPLSARLSSR